MTRAGEFQQLSIDSDNERNGERARWVVKFTATAEVKEGDLFTLEIPKTIRTPADPICEK